MNANANKGIAHLWFEAFNAHDLEALVSLYADDAEHFSPKLKQLHPETKGKIRGKDALRDWWRDAFVRMPTLNYKMTRLTACPECGQPVRKGPRLSEQFRAVTIP